MITCRKLIRFLDDYVSGELPEPMRKQFESHLQACPPCKAYLESYRATIELERASLRCSGSAAPEPMPEALVHAILQACREAGEANRPEGND